MTAKTTTPAEPKAPKAPAEPKAKDILMTVPSTGEKVVYSKKVHGEDYREIAERDAKRFDAILTEIE